MKNSIRVNVRTLAEFYTEGGDLFYTGGAMERMREGVRGHQAIQSAYGEEREKEVSLSMDVEAEGLMLRLYGRADGLCRTSVPPVIEEIKTTERSIHEIGADDVPAHWMQAVLYGAMLCEREGFESVSLRLTYLSLSGGQVSFSRSFTRRQLHEKMLLCAAPYAKWLSSLLRWRERAAETIRPLPFPFEKYRAGQRDMAANAYVALRDRKNLLCQAPTGTGKTAAALYPALKALGEQKIDRVFFLTARTTGQRAAEEALRRMRTRGLIARSVTLSARDKVCIQPELPCSPETCPRANGYFDRRRAALYEALTLQDFSPEAIAALAEKHTLCPFEFSLDLSETADVVIGDYNYLFDPKVKLQRFFTGQSEAGILIDEAHNLAPRARDMLSASLPQRTLRELRARVGKESGRKHPLYRALTPLLQAFKETRAAVEAETILEELPAPLIEAARNALPTLAESLHLPAAWHGDATDAFFTLADFLRCADGYDENFRTLLRPDGKSMLDVTLMCVHPAPHIAAALRRVHGAVLFSATLSPMTFYRDMTGLSEEKGDALLDLPSPFPPENFLALRAPLPVRYREREQSMPRVAAFIHAFISARPGNYMLFFPSYAYLSKAHEALLPLLDNSVRLIAQSREMDDAARSEFLSEFSPAPGHTLVGLAVLGGSFAEGIDLPGSRLTGAVIVGTGVPQICAENDALRAFFEERLSNGYRYAYLYPGVARVLQAAGRVIRTEEDQGAVLLIDSRWSDAEHTSLLPPHWRTETVRTEEALSARLAAFYRSFSGK